MESYSYWFKRCYYCEHDLLDENVIFIFNSVSNLYAYFIELLIYNIYCPYFQGSKIHASIFKKDIILRHKGTLIKGNCCTIQRFSVVKILVNTRQQ